jgi:hypothetical protein
MKLKLIRFLVLVIPVITGLSLSSLGVQGDVSPWTSVGPGIDFQVFHLPGPTVAYVARMDRSNPDVIIDSAIAQGRLSGGRETVSAMASRYDGALNFWDGAWGATNQVVVAINGSYFYGTGDPIGGIIQSGWYAKRFPDLGGGSGFAWNLDRTAFIGQCVTNPANRQVIVGPGGYIREISAVNVPREPGQVVMYTPQWDSTTLTGNDGSELLIEMTAPTLVIPAPRLVLGYVREVRAGQGNSPIPFNYVVISGQGRAGDELVSRFKVGDPIGISQEIRHFQSDCETPNGADWTKTYASVGGAVIFLKDGQIPPGVDPAKPVYQPRTAVAYNQEYIYFMVVDGRVVDYSQGMTFTQLGEFSRDALGATWGIAEDGGGSSTMVINGKVVNRAVSACNTNSTSDQLYLPMIVQDGSQSGNGYPAPPVSTPQDTAGDSNYHCQREVADALMMVAVHPMQQSTTFTAGQSVVLPSQSNLRLGPGSNYGVLASVPAGATGSVEQQFNDLDGVLAKGAYWWKVSVEGLSGWLPETALSLPQPNPALPENTGRNPQP